MAPLRTPLEVALGERFPLDFADCDYADLDAAEASFEAGEASLLSAAVETGDLLFREAVRASVPRMGGA